MAASRAPSPALGWILAHRSIVRTGPLAMVRKRRLDGMLATMRSSGSHYLQWMLCMTMCEGLGLDHPKHLNDPSLIGFMHDLPPRRDLPRVVRTHTEMPTPIFKVLHRLVGFPHYVVLVRDLRATIVSYYEKDPPAKRRSTFSQYLRGKDTFLTDHVLFRQMRFLNSWARVRQIDPGRLIVVRYEDMKESPARELERAWRFLKFPDVDQDVFRRAVELSTKDRMAQYEDGRERRVVRKDKTHPHTWYDDDDRAYFQAAVDRYLLDDYGYDFTDWSTAEDAPAAAPDPGAPAAATT